jgi:large subunit ribosomal protein L1
MAEAKKATTKKATKKTTVEEPITPEKDITQAAIESAEEQQTIINEKRETADESVIAVDSETILDATLTETEEEASTAKAGKRSTKALREAAEKQAKEERKASGEEAEAKPKQPVKPTRSRLERRGKKFRQSAELIDRSKLYTLEEAIGLAKKTNPSKFDATVELHINLGVDPRHADQNIRDNLVLPAGTGRTVKIAVLTDDAEAAKKAGADVAGTDELLAQLDKGTLDFDILIATPALMPRLGKYARVLGPRGLMPNPKSGTVTTDIQKAVAEAKAGRVEYRVDSTGIVHIGIGKVSFDDVKLLDNLQAVLASIKSNKPQSVKGNYFKAVFVTTTMGPSVKVDLTNIG